MQKEYDIMVVGPISLDHNIDYLGNERREVGGAVVASGFAAAGSGAKTAIFCKSNAADVPLHSANKHEYSQYRSRQALYVYHPSQRVYIPYSPTYGLHPSYPLFASSYP